MRQRSLVRMDRVIVESLEARLLLDGQLQDSPPVLEVQWAGLPGVHEFALAPAPAGASVTRAVTVRNEGQADLVISAAAGLAGPFGVRPVNASGNDADDWTILPGGTMMLEITFAAPAGVAPASYTDVLTLVSNDPGQAAYEIALSAQAGPWGDLTADAAVDAGDIDALATALRTAEADAGDGTGLTGADAAGDLDGDGQLTRADMDELVLRILSTRYGDADLDGDVDGRDFLTWQAGYPTPAGASWSAGDFDGDGRVGGRDFLLWQTNYGFRRPDLHVVSITPGSTTGGNQPDYIDVTFNQAVPPGSFTVDDVGIIPATPYATVPLGGLAEGYTVRMTDLHLLGDYVAGLIGRTLFILDISVPASPVVVGSYVPGTYATPRVHSLEVVGSTAYLAVDTADQASGAIEIVDLSTPSAPALAGVFLAEPPVSSYNGLLRVAVADSTAVLLSSDSQSVLLVIDVSEPSAPAARGSLVLAGGTFTRLAMAGTQAFVGGLNSRPRIIDVSVPTAPRLVGTCPTGAQNFQVVGSLMYMAGENGLTIVDISVPSSPVTVGSFPMGVGYMNQADVAVIGSQAFLLEVVYGSLVVLDVSVPSSPIQLSRTVISGAERITVVGDQLIVSLNGHDKQLVVIDPLGPWPADMVGQVPMPQLDPDGMDLIGSTAYVADGSAGLRVVSVETPSTPQEIGLLDTAGNARQVQVQGEIAYVADDIAGLLLVDVSDPAVPAALGSLDTPGEARDVAVVGRYAYVADGTAGLQIVDVWVPAMPVLVGSFDTPGTAMAVDVVGSLAYVADDTGGLQIVDVSNPSVPFRAGQFVSRWYVRGVRVVGSLAYLAAFQGLAVVDVSVPAAPLEVARVDLPALRAEDVDVIGSLAYLTGTSGLVYGGSVFVFDISTPSVPVLLTSTTSTVSYTATKGFQCAGGMLYEVCPTGLRSYRVFSLVGSIVPLSPTTYRVYLTDPLDIGPYSVQIGPDVAGIDGRLLNTDGDATGGEGNDDVWAVRLEVGAA